MCCLTTSQKKTKTCQDALASKTRRRGLQGSSFWETSRHTHVHRWERTRRREPAHLHFYNESGAGHLRFQHSATSPRKTELKHARPLSAKQGGWFTGLLRATSQREAVTAFAEKRSSWHEWNCFFFGVLGLRCCSEVFVMMMSRFCSFVNTCLYIKICMWNVAEIDVFHIFNLTF